MTDTENINMFRHTLSKFVRDELKPFTDEWEKNGELPRDVFKKVGQQGFFGLRIDEKYGGMGLDFFYTVVLCEELVRCGSVGTAVSLMAHCEFAMSSLNEEGNEKQKEKYLQDAVKGEKIWGLAITEPGFGSDVANISTRAKKKDEKYIINGAKTFITNGTIADFLVLAVRTGKKEDGARGLSLLIFPTDTKGFEKRRIKKIGAHASDTAELFFSDCEIPVENLLGEEGKGFYYIMKHFQGERLVLSSFGNGVMKILIEEALKYGVERKVFDKKLLEHQIWRHRISDLITLASASRELTYAACKKFVETGMASKEIAIAKLFMAYAVKRVADEVSQMFGGYGYMDEYLVARLRRDTLGFGVGAGTDEVMREIIFKETLKDL